MPDIVTRLINVHDAMDALRETVQGKEDYVYNPQSNPHACKYFNDSEPSCVVGQVLVRLRPGIDFSPIEGNTVTEVVKKFGIFKPDAGNLLRKAQIIQDEGGTWGKALEVAETYYKELVYA